MKQILFIALLWLTLLLNATEGTQEQAMCDLANAFTIPTQSSPIVGWSCGPNSAPVSPVCSWTGVLICNTMGGIARISLSGLKIVGTIPPTIAQLTSLTDLDISSNSIGGTLPSGIFQSLTNLVSLNIFSNRFSQTFPSTIGYLKALTYLSVALNKFNGNIPSTISSLKALTFLSFGINNFLGTIPPSIQSLTGLTYLGFNGNKLTGTLTSGVGALTKLVYFDVFGNSLNGTIPSSIGNLLSLTYLGLFNNNFYGSLPATIGSITNLNYFSILNNKLSGTIPSSLCSLTTFYVFLNGNQFSCYSDCIGNTGITTDSNCYTCLNVAFFASCGYQGSSIGLGVGIWNMGSQLCNDCISSVTIPLGFIVTIYDYSTNTGQSLTLYSSVSCLPSIWLNRVSSATVTFAGTMVIFYSSANYQGAAQALGIGGWNATYGALPCTACISSIYIPAGVLSVKAFDRTGASTVFTTSVPSLSTWDNRISNVQITLI